MFDQIAWRIKIQAPPACNTLLYPAAVILTAVRTYSSFNYIFLYIIPELELSISVYIVKLGSHPGLFSAYNFAKDFNLDIFRLILTETNYLFIRIWVVIIHL